MQFRFIFVVVVAAAAATGAAVSFPVAVSRRFLM